MPLSTSPNKPENSDPPGPRISRLPRRLACHVSRWIRLSKSLVGSTSGCSQTTDRFRHSNSFPEPSVFGRLRLPSALLTNQSVKNVLEAFGKPPVMSVIAATQSAGSSLLAPIQEASSSTIPRSWGARFRQAFPPIATIRGAIATCPTPSVYGGLRSGTTQ